MESVHVGLDVGQQKDPTAIVVAEMTRRKRDDGNGSESVFLVRDLTRLRLGTPYPEVVASVVGVVGRVNARIGEDGGSSPTPWLCVDATGVGQPVCDELRKALAGQDVHMSEAVFMAGDPTKLNVSPGMRRFSVSKMGLVARLQTLLAWRWIRLPRTPMALALADELRDFEIRPAGTNDIAGAFRVGAHDDLVTALGLATLEPPRSVYEDRGLVVLDVGGRW